MKYKENQKRCISFDLYSILLLFILTFYILDILARMFKPYDMLMMKNNRKQEIKQQN